MFSLTSAAHVLFSRTLLPLREYPVVQVVTTNLLFVNSFAFADYMRRGSSRNAQDASRAFECLALSALTAASAAGFQLWAPTPNDAAFWGIFGRTGSAAFWLFALASCNGGGGINAALAASLIGAAPWLLCQSAEVGSQPLKAMMVLAAAACCFGANWSIDKMHLRTNLRNPLLLFYAVLAAQAITYIVAYWRGDFAETPMVFILSILQSVQVIACGNFLLQEHNKAIVDISMYGSTDFQDMRQPSALY